MVITMNKKVTKMKDLKLSVLFMSASLAFFGCNQSTELKSDVVAPETEVKSAGTSTLEKVLQAQPEDVIARYDARHPQETLNFLEYNPV